MNDANSCGVTFNLHLHDCGPLNMQVCEIPRRGQPEPDTFAVSIGAGVRIQEVCLYLDQVQLVQLADVLGIWARAIQEGDLPSQVGAVDPQQDDDLIDVRGDK